jgi:hypothetical protein
MDAESKAVKIDLSWLTSEKTLLSLPPQTSFSVDYTMMHGMIIVIAVIAITTIIITTNVIMITMIQRIGDVWR